MTPEELKQRLISPFQAAEVRIRDGKPPMPYVTARVVMSRLDEVLPFQWSFNLLESWVDDKGTLNQKGRLTLNVNLWNDGGVSINTQAQYEDIGSAPPDVGNAPKKQAKQAVSDCLKRCAVHAGIFRYGYELQGVRSDGIPEASLKKALAAVGYTGPIERHHWGKIGGVRELDYEDEEAGPVANGAVPDPLATKEQQKKVGELLKQAFETGAERHSFFVAQTGKETIPEMTASDFFTIAAALQERLKPSMAPTGAGLLGDEAPPEVADNSQAIAALKG